MKVSRQLVISKLLAASRQRLAEEQRLDCEIVATLQHLIWLLIDRYQNWSGRYLSIGPESTGNVLTASEIRQLIHARAASRSEFNHRVAAAIVRDALRKAPEDCAFAISGLFTPNNHRVSPEPVERCTTPLIELLTEMEK